MTREEIGYYDDMCGMCRKEMAVSIYSEDQEEWDCPVCEYTNPVRMEE